MALYSALLIPSLLFCAESPIPDPAALMKQVQAHREKMDEVRENYTYRRIRRVEELDGNGEVRKTTIVEREIFYVNGHQIARLIKRYDVPRASPKRHSPQD